MAAMTTCPIVMSFKWLTLVANRVVRGTLRYRILLGATLYLVHCHCYLLDISQTYTHLHISRFDGLKILLDCVVVTSSRCSFLTGIKVAFVHF